MQHGLIGIEKRNYAEAAKSHKGPMTMKNSAKKRMLMPIEQRSPMSERRGPKIHSREE